MFLSGFGKLPENDQGRSWRGRQCGVVEETSPRLEGLLLPSIADVLVLSLDVSHEAIRIDLCSTAAGAACPDCGSESTRVHSTYLRFPADVPSGGRLVVLQLRVRRFFCPESSCARRTFAEQLPGLTRRHSRWTERLRSALAAVGLALAGRAGARMARAFGVSAMAGHQGANFVLRG